MSEDYLFEDGTIESKVLQYELRNERPQIITVDKFENINKWLESVDKNNINKIYLHFSYDQITPGIRAEINTALTKYPNLRIILKYENMDTRTIENLASKYGITVEAMTYNTKTQEIKKQVAEVDEILEANKDKIKTIDYGKYAVGGNDSAVGATTTATVDKFADKSNWFRDKRRRKKKDVDDSTNL